MFDIDETKPLPQSPAPKGRQAIYPFVGMSIGDSFWAPSSSAEKARMAAAARKRNHASSGWDYTARAEAGGLRIWRTA